MATVTETCRACGKPLGGRETICFQCSTKAPVVRISCLECEAGITVKTDAEAVDPETLAAGNAGYQYSRLETVAECYDCGGPLVVTEVG